MNDETQRKYLQSVKRLLTFRVELKLTGTIQDLLLMRLVCVRLAACEMCNESKQVELASTGSESRFHGYGTLD